MLAYHTLIMIKLALEIEAIYPLIRDEPKKGTDGGALR